MRAGAPPGRLEPEPERSGSPGGAGAGRRARSCSRHRCHAPECHLRDIRRPPGSGGGEGAAPPSQPGWGTDGAPGTDGASPAQSAVGTNTALGTRPGMRSARQSPLLPPPSLYSVARQLPITFRPSLSGCDTQPPPACWAFGSRHSPLPQAGGEGGAVTGAGFNPVCTTGI